MSKVYAQWKEQLIWDSWAERLTIEFAMGIPTISFPTRETWSKASPPIKADYDRVLKDVTAWARKERVALVVEDRAWVFATNK